MARIKRCAMGQVLHGSATTTEAIRRAIQHSKESLRALSRRYGINQKTVRKWKARSSVVDRRTRPKEPRSTVLSIEEEAVIVGFRRHTLLPTAWDRPSCSDRKRQAGKEKVQVLSDRLLPHRHRRSADRRGKALPLRGDRQNFEVRLRPTCRKSQSCHRIGLPGRLGQSRSLQNPYGAHR